MLELFTILATYACETHIAVVLTCSCIALTRHRDTLPSYRPCHIRQHHHDIMALLKASVLSLLTPLIAHRAIASPFAPGILGHTGSDVVSGSLTDGVASTPTLSRVGSIKVTNEYRAPLAANSVNVNTALHPEPLALPTSRPRSASAAPPDDQSAPLEGDVLSFGKHTIFLETLAEADSSPAAMANDEAKMTDPTNRQLLPLPWDETQSDVWSCMTGNKPEGYCSETYGSDKVTKWAAMRKEDGTASVFAQSRDSAASEKRYPTDHEESVSKNFNEVMTHERHAIGKRGSVEERGGPILIRRPFDEGNPILTLLDWWDWPINFPAYEYCVNNFDRVSCDEYYTPRNNWAGADCKFTTNSTAYEECLDVLQCIRGGRNARNNTSNCPGKLGYYIPDFPLYACLYPVEEGKPGNYSKLGPKFSRDCETVLTNLEGTNVDWIDLAFPWFPGKRS